MGVFVQENIKALDGMRQKVPEDSGFVGSEQVYLTGQQPNGKYGSLARFLTPLVNL